MKKFSELLKVIWKISAHEAIENFRQEEISPDHILLAIFIVVDISDEKIRKRSGLKGDIFIKLLEEKNLLGSILYEKIKDMKSLIEEFKKNIPVGSASDNIAIIHRDIECRKVFDKSREISKGAGSSEITVFHLFQALLESKKEHIIKFLENRGINIDNLINRFQELTIIDPVDIPFAARDLTDLAGKNKLTTIFGRDDEIKSLARAISKMRKNSVILIGEPGIGKTAIVEGLAVSIKTGKIRGEGIEKIRIVEIDTAGFFSGAKYVGDIEKRMKILIEAGRTNKGLIYFFDEIHALMVDSGSKGSKIPDLLKPAIQNGDLRCIGATTFSEFKKFIEPDPALKRRFQPLIIKEPDIKQTELILKKVKRSFEDHHGVSISNDILKTVIDLSQKYLSEQFFPDKALDLLDEASTILKIRSFHYNRDTIDLKLEKGHLAEAISNRTGIPVEIILEDDLGRVKNIGQFLKKRIIGQDEAIDNISASIVEVNALGRRGNKPMGIFLFTGATGTGKTETAKVLRDFLFPGSGNGLLTFDMSEYSEKSSALKLIGAPPGYIGFDSGGQLIDKVRKNPHSIILFDEIEKANERIFDLLLQVFDEARLTDGAGRTADFKNCYIILTSNLGSSLHDPEIYDNVTGLNRKNYKNKILSSIIERFRPEFLARIPDKVIFYPLEKADLRSLILRRFLPEIKARFSSRGIELELSSEAVEYFIKRNDPRWGVRNIGFMMDKKISKPLIGEIVAGDIINNIKVEVTVEKGNLNFRTLKKN